MVPARRQMRYWPAFGDLPNAGRRKCYRAVQVTGLGFGLDELSQEPLKPNVVDVPEPRLVA